MLPLSSSFLFCFSIIIFPLPQKVQEKNSFSEKVFYTHNSVLWWIEREKCQEGQISLCNKLTVIEAGLPAFFLLPTNLHSNISFLVTYCFQKAMGLRTPRALFPSSTLPMEPLPVIRWFQIEQEMKFDQVTKTGKFWLVK